MDMDNKKINNWVDIVKIAMEQSISLFILVFSCLLVISSIITDAETKYVLASFFTLFYAIANHFLGHSNPSSRTLGFFNFFDF